MAEFILTDIVMLSLGVLLYLIARSLPRLEEGEPAHDKQTVIDRLLHSHIPHKIDMEINAYSGKLFRKMKISLLKFDNYLTKRLKSINNDNVNRNGKPKIDFSDITKNDLSVGESEGGGEDTGVV